MCVFLEEQLHHKKIHNYSDVESHGNETEHLEKKMILLAIQNLSTVSSYYLLSLSVIKINIIQHSLSNSLNSNYCYHIIIFIIQ